MCVLMWMIPYEVLYSSVCCVRSAVNGGNREPAVCVSLLPSSVRRNGASAQAAACQAFEDAHGDVHKWAEVKEQVVESVHWESSGLICIFHGHNGCVEAIGQIPESGSAGFNHFLGALDCE